MTTSKNEPIVQIFQKAGRHTQVDKNIHQCHKRWTMRAISEQELLSSPIKGIYGTIAPHRPSSWLECGSTYFILESGLSFEMPWSHQSHIENIRIPRKAKPLPKSEQSQIAGQKIKCIYRQFFEREDSGDSCVLELSNGNFLTATMMAPQGVSGVGLWLHTAEEWATVIAEDERLELVSFWV